MIALFVLLGMTAANADEVGPENWACAIPLIEKDYKQADPPTVLAHAIADKCANPFKSDKTDQALLEIQRTVYRGARNVFVDDIGAQILNRRLQEENGPPKPGRRSSADERTSG
jgi:hypothetical protein